MEMYNSFVMRIERIERIERICVTITRKEKYAGTEGERRKTKTGKTNK